MKLIPITPESKKIKGIVSFINDIEVVKVNNKIYPLVYTATGIHDLYSLPSNDYHKPYTKTRQVDLDALHDKDVVLKSWSIYKKGNVVYGYIKDDKFYAQ